MTAVKNHTPYRRAYSLLLRDFRLFCEQSPGFRLRSYQLIAAQGILEAIRRHKGQTVVVMFPRQSGKNTLQAALEAYLLWCHQFRGTEMVKVSPTWRPQSQNAMRRLQSTLESNLLTRRIWRKDGGNIYRIGRARLLFLSGAPESHIVGASASLLLQVDEAQDVQIAKYDKDIAPMAASQNASRVFWGTAWTNETLLARELRLARQSGGRVYVLNADQVAGEIPAYGEFVAGQVARLGRDHPYVRTQYFSEEIEAGGSLFGAGRLVLLQGTHPPQAVPLPNCIYALLVDVAGAEEENSSTMAAFESPPPGGGRDSTAVTVVDVDLSGLGDTAIQRPVYRVVHRYEWVGVPQTALFERLKALARHWQARSLVVDATGLGAGLASFLIAAMPRRILPFTFTAQSKSRLGWDFLALIDSGRFQELDTPPHATEQGNLHERFLRQIMHIRHYVREGGLLHWEVPQGTCDPVNGEILHDDLVMSAALCATLDERLWGEGESAIIQPENPWKKLKPVY
jgi:hypothetical protein